MFRVTFTPTLGSERQPHRRTAFPHRLCDHLLPHNAEIVAAMKTGGRFPLRAPPPAAG
jgi:hypothetical protein